MATKLKNVTIKFSDKNASHQAWQLLNTPCNEFEKTLEPIKYDEDSDSILLSIKVDSMAESGTLLCRFTEVVDQLATRSFLCTSFEELVVTKAALLRGAEIENIFDSVNCTIDVEIDNLDNYLVSYKDNTMNNASYREINQKLIPTIKPYVDLFKNGGGVVAFFEEDRECDIMNSKLYQEYTMLEILAFCSDMCSIEEFEKCFGFYETENENIVRDHYFNEVEVSERYHELIGHIQNHYFIRIIPDPWERLLNGE